MELYFRILEPVSLKIVNQDMIDKGSSETNMPFGIMLMIMSLY